VANIAQNLESTCTLSTIHYGRCSQLGVNLPLRVNFTYAEGKFNDAEVTIGYVVFFYSASEQTKNRR